MEAPSKKKSSRAAVKKAAVKRKAAPKAAKKGTKKAPPPAAKKRSAAKKARGTKAVPKRAAKKIAATRAVPKKVEKKTAPAAKKQAAAKTALGKKAAAKKAAGPSAAPKRVEKKAAHAPDKLVPRRRRAAAREQRRGAEDSAAVKKAAAVQAALKAAERQAAEKQVGHYDKAVRYFNNRRFAMALPWFEKIVGGPNSSLRHRAEVHARICRRQIESNKVKLRTVDDYYNYGIKLVNDRQLDEAEKHFQKALKMAPKGDHVYYAYAVARALSGDAEGASVNLKRAIELNGRNRLLARSDSDFSKIVRHPLITELLWP